VTRSLVISIDAMGGDHGPSIVLPGLALAAQALPAARFVVHGDEGAIAPHLASQATLKDRVEVRHTEKKIASDEKPAQALRRGKGSSMWNAVELVKAGEADAAVSAGNTGALMAISLLVLRTSVDVERPCLVVSWPGVKGVSTVLDVGANVDCDAERLVEFAIMGEAFMTAVHGIARPTIGILNVGSEDMKGHEEVREAARLLREGGLGLDYFGFVEGTDIAKGTVDVVVTDGFTGNIALKTAEGVAKFIASLMKDALTSSPTSKLGALLAMPALKRMGEKIDPNANNGGPLLGLNGIVVKSHGGATPAGYGAAIRVAVELTRSDYLVKVRHSFSRLTVVLEQPAADGAAMETSL
jgi:glycerol-3-phosphate acyltransferase PlsX